VIFLVFGLIAVRMTILAATIVEHDVSFTLHTWMRVNLSDFHRLFS